MRTSTEAPGGYGVVSAGDYRRQMVLAMMFLTILSLRSTPVLALSGPCPSAIFSFGDSLSDTGSLSNVFPGSEPHDHPPYGEQFFNKPSKRSSDGRLILDFFALAFGRKPLLQPYIQNGPFDYRFGVNFAFGGATASGDIGTLPVSLGSQILQFLSFKMETEKLCEEGGCDRHRIKLPTKEVFESAMYYLEIGAMDLMNAVIEGHNQSYVLDHVIPAALKVITSSAKALYENGARRFLFMTTACTGCYPFILTPYGETAQLDSMGCVQFVNDNNQAYNAALRSVVAGLRLEFPEAQMDIFDFYAANVEIVKNPKTYGFDPEKTLIACCGAAGAGRYNYNEDLLCGTHGVPMCAKPDEHVLPNRSSVCAGRKVQRSGY